MTEEELAEEYVRQNCDDSINSFRGQELKQAFLAGLNAKTQWHDLKENPDDLPKHSNNVLCVLWEDTYEIGYCNIDSDDDLWHFEDFSISRERRDEVIAWCEIPTFKE